MRLRKRAGIIWSVSTFLAVKQVTREVTRSSLVIVYSSALVVEQSAKVGHFSCHGRSGRGLRRCEEGPASRALPPFKVTIAGADGDLSGFEFVCIHGDAHAATGLPPLGAGFLENSVQ